jgi:hypothetical protein
MIKDNNRPLRCHKIMTSFLGLNKRTRTSSSTDFLLIDFLGIPDYIANSSQYLTLNSIIKSV